MSQSERFSEELDDTGMGWPGAVRFDRRKPGWATAIGPVGHTPLQPASGLEPERLEVTRDRDSLPLRGIAFAVVASLPLWAVIAAIWLI